jgi:hypothetical protein
MEAKVSDAIEVFETILGLVVEIQHCPHRDTQWSVLDTESHPQLFLCLDCGAWHVDGKAWQRSKLHTRVLHAANCLEENLLVKDPAPAATPAPAPEPTPARFIQIQATGEALHALDTEGCVWALWGNSWTKLPEVRQASERSTL